MGRIPIITNDVTAKIGRSEGNQINAFATPDAFGAQKGKALQVLAGGLGQAADQIDQYVARKRDETVANRVAQSDFTPTELKIRSEAPADGAGLYDKTMTEFDKYVDDQANQIPDDIARQNYRLRMSEQRRAVSARTITTQYALDSEYGKQQAEASLMSLENKIMTDPSGYDMYIKQGYDVLDTRQNVPANIRESMKLNWRQASAKARFTGMMESAKTIEDIDRISHELVGTTGKERDDTGAKDWTKEMSPKDFEDTVNTLGAARKTIQTQATADARAALETLTERNNGLALIPKDELKLVMRQAANSGDPILIGKAARIQRDQNILEQVRKLPPAEQRAQINAAKGDPGTAFPGVPPRVSNAINDATSKFGVSASYLASTAVREYGEHFKRKPNQVNTQYSPQSVHSGVDLRNVRADVVEAATVAGELFGAPLQITSGYRSQAKQDSIRRRGNPNRPGVARDSHHTHGTGIDISTAGMSDEEKGKLAGALVDAGFTGIGEYDTHIHGDFRSAVPNSYGARDGKTWGGWTYLSPSVVAQLEQRGFAAGVAGTELKRGRPVQYSDDVDYTQGTSIEGDDGRPTTGVVGVMQFTPGTFLSTVKDPSVAAKLGLDLTGMTDADILELRKNPEISILAGAALGEKNRKTMESTLGRSIDDAELYMAHFLGSGGAITLIKSREQQGNQSAAALLPKAAAANRPVFYTKDGKARTVNELYNELSRSYVAAPSNVQYGDVEVRQKVLDQTEKQIKEDPMQLARDSGTQTIPEFNMENIGAYGQAARSVADYYNIPMSDMKVLGASELEYLKSELDGASADEAMNILTSLQGMGDDVARAAYKQLEQKDSVYGYVAQFAHATGDMATATNIMRGRKRLDENPSLRKELDASDEDLSTAFREATGNSLNLVPAKIREDMQNAAVAHYVETFMARGRGTGFSEDAFRESVKTVVGSTGGLQDVNGEPTVLPSWATGEQFEDALQNMTIADWTDMSKDGLPPRYGDGTIIEPDQIADEAKLRALGQDQYRVQLDDGTYLTNGRTDGNGLPMYFIFTPKEERIVALQNKAQPVEPSADNTGFYDPTGSFRPDKENRGLFGRDDFKPKPIVRGFYNPTGAQ